MGILETLLEGIPLVKMAKVKQSFPSQRLSDVLGTTRAGLERLALAETVKPGMSVAIAVGSRGIRDIAQVTAEVVSVLKGLGAHPFVVPAMGSHGGATAEGQAQVLAHLGVTEQTIGAPIRSSMEVIEVARLDNGLPVYVDRFAAGADGIVVINRIKPHTAFRGPYESGLLKMISIGLGKQKGAEACHQLGFKHMAKHVPEMAKMVIERLPVLFGVGIIENAYDETADVIALSPQGMIEKEPELLERAKSLMPRLPYDEIDVLVVHEIGKNISGDGMDPNITGRYPTPYASGGPVVEKIVVLDVTEASEGNANGVGTGDFTTQQLIDKMDRAATYANGLTSTVVAPTKIPTTLANHRDAIRAGIKTCNRLELDQARLVYIKNTLALGELYVSESLLKVTPSTDLEVLTEPKAFTFDAEGNIEGMW